MRDTKFTYLILFVLLIKEEFTCLILFVLLIKEGIFQDLDLDKIGHNFMLRIIWQKLKPNLRKMSLVYS